MCGTLTLEFPINRAVIIVHLRKVLFHTWNGQFDWEKKNVLSADHWCKAHAIILTSKAIAITHFPYSSLGSRVSWWITNKKKHCINRISWKSTLKMFHHLAMHCSKNPPQEIPWMISWRLTDVRPSKSRWCAAALVSACHPPPLECYKKEVDV